MGGANIAYPLYLSHYIILTQIFPKFSRFSFAIEIIIFWFLALFLAYMLDITTKKILQIIQKKFSHKKGLQ